MELLTVKEVAAFLKVTEKTVRGWIKSKADFKAASLQLGSDDIRFIKSELENYILNLAKAPII